jgi:hypothetical protein
MAKPVDLSKMLRNELPFNYLIILGSLGVTTNVSIAFYIESMSSFKAQTMDYEVDKATKNG